MININFVDWQKASNKEENDSIYFLRDSFKSKLKTFKSIKNGTGSVSFSNNDPDLTKFVFVSKENTSSLSDKFWSDFLQMYFPDEMGG